jgi:hypothetical protein
MFVVNVAVIAAGAIGLGGELVLFSHKRGILSRLSSMLMRRVEKP